MLQLESKRTKNVTEKKLKDNEEESNQRLNKMEYSFKSNNSKAKTEK